MVEHVLFLVIHTSATVQMGSQGKDVRIVMNVPIILVKMVEPAKTKSTLSLVNVQMASLETIAKLMLMIVMESSV